MTARDQLAGLRRWVGRLAGPVSKLLGAVLGGATGVGVSGVLEAVGWHVTPEVAAGIAMVLAGLVTWRVPANTPGDDCREDGTSPQR